MSWRCQSEVLKRAPAVLQRWVRTRARQGGFPQPQGVLLVSALKGQGVQELLIRLHQEVGPAGDVWVVRLAALSPVVPCTVFWDFPGCLQHCLCSLPLHQSFSRTACAGGPKQLSWRVFCHG